RRDPEHAGQPAPENCTGTSKSDRCSNTDDISGADRGRQCRGQRTELADFSVSAVFFGYGKRDSFCDRLSLDKACPYRQEQVRSQQKQNHCPAPYDIVDRLDEPIDFLIHLSSSSSSHFQSCLKQKGIRIPLSPAGMPYAPIFNTTLLFYRIFPLM